MIINADIMEWCKTYDGPPFHAALTDPPYELAFMNAAWDASGISFRAETWAAIKEHLLPGAWGMAFASSRGWHRMAVAIEDAGFIMQPTIGNWTVPMMLAWSFGNGMPKSTRIRIPGTQETHEGWEGHRYGGQVIRPSFEPVIVFQKPYEGRSVECITTTGAGALWIDGARLSTRIRSRKETSQERKNYVYGKYKGSAYDGSGGRWPSNLILTHHADCNEVCVESCPVTVIGEQSERKTTDGRPYIVKKRPAEGDGGGWGTQEGTLYNDAGTASRFFYQSDWTHEIAEHMAGVDPVFYCAKASVNERDAGLKEDIELITIVIGGDEWGNENTQARLLVDTAHLPPRVIAAYTTQTSDDTGWNTFLFGNSITGQFPLEGKSITVTEINSITESKTLSWLIRSLTSVYTADVKSGTVHGGSHVRNAERSIPQITFINTETVFVPGVGPVSSGTLLKISAKGAFPVVTVSDGRDKSIDNAYQRGKTERRNIHATIKPIRLTQHLATLLLPPAMYAPRRILIPFAGVASEMIGALKAGWEEIVGIELTPEYIPYAEARIAYWSGHDVPSSVSARQAAASDEQESQQKLGF